MMTQILLWVRSVIADPYGNKLCGIKDLFDGITHLVFVSSLLWVSFLATLLPILQQTDDRFPFWVFGVLAVVPLLLLFAAAIANVVYVLSRIPPFTKPDKTFRQIIGCIFLILLSSMLGVGLFGVAVLFLYRGALPLLAT